VAASTAAQANSRVFIALLPDAIASG